MLLIPNLAKIMNLRIRPIPHINKGHTTTDSLNAAEHQVSSLHLNIPLARRNTHHTPGNILQLSTDTSDIKKPRGRLLEHWTDVMIAELQRRGNTIPGCSTAASIKTH